MPRPLKPQEVDRLRFPDKGITVAIMLDRNNLDFFAQLTPAHPVIRAKNADDLKREVRLAAKEYRPFVWRREIWIDAKEPHGRGRHFLDDPPDMGVAVVGLEYDRHWVADVPATPADLGRADRKRIVERPWRDEGDEGDPDDLTLRLDTHYGGPTRKYVVPYTPNTWAALQAIEARILTARKQLFDLLGGPDLPAPLDGLGRVAGTLLLGPGK